METDEGWTTFGEILDQVDDLKAALSKAHARIVELEDEVARLTER